MSGARLWLLVLGLLALATALWLWWRASTARARSGLPRGEVVYADMAGWMRAKPLYAPRYRLAGKPDYLVRQGQELIPVEVKPHRRSAEPYEADILQLAAYCLLVEEDLGAPPACGLLRYAERTFRIPYEPHLRESLMATLQAMRSDLEQPDVPRSHEDPVRCRYCGVRQDCQQALS